MKHYIFAGPAAVLVVGGLVGSAPPAIAGCLYGGLSASRCDGPVQPDGTWQRCVIFN
ncbi:CDGP domain-containing protein, partial [Mycobacterium sp.]|uniref:CDGP domain-containing protein n=1 Tax=Mycobacterium sp. TaxID=1785 RepID=UPI003BB0E348